MLLLAGCVTHSDGDKLLSAYKGALDTKDLHLESDSDFALFFKNQFTALNEETKYVALQPCQTDTLTGGFIDFDEMSAHEAGQLALRQTQFAILVGYNNAMVSLITGATLEAKTEFDKVKTNIIDPIAASKVLNGHPEIAAFTGAVRTISDLMDEVLAEGEAAKKDLAYREVAKLARAKHKYVLQTIGNLRANLNSLSRETQILWKVWEQCEDSRVKLLRDSPTITKSTSVELATEWRFSQQRKDAIRAQLPDLNKSDAALKTIEDTHTALMKADQPSFDIMSIKTISGDVDRIHDVTVKVLKLADAPPGKIQGAAAAAASE